MFALIIFSLSGEMDMLVTALQPHTLCGGPLLGIGL